MRIAAGVLLSRCPFSGLTSLLPFCALLSQKPSIRKRRNLSRPRDGLIDSPALGGGAFPTYPSEPTFWREIDAGAFSQLQPKARRFDWKVRK